MKPGQPPYPRKLRILNGETKPSRVGKPEPIPRDALPVCPRTATRDVHEVWDYTMVELKAMGLATAADRDALLCYCQAVVTHRDAAAQVEEEGLLVRQMNGARGRNPAEAIMRDAAKLVMQYAQQFGLTPSARTGMKMPEQDSGHRGERLLS